MGREVELFSSLVEQTGGGDGFGYVKRCYTGCRLLLPNFGQIPVWANLGKTGSGLRVHLHQGTAVLLVEVLIEALLGRINHSYLALTHVVV